MAKDKGRKWDAKRVRALRARLGLSQGALAEELGMRQQTVSEWETGRHEPRGASVRLLGMIAERSEFEYVPQSRLPVGRAETPDAGEDHQ